MSTKFNVLKTPGELNDLEKQLNEGGLNAHELEKAKKRLEQEKEELTQSVEVMNAGFVSQRALHNVTKIFGEHLCQAINQN